MKQLSLPDRDLFMVEITSVRHLYINIETIIHVYMNAIIQLKQTSLAPYCQWFECQPLLTAILAVLYELGS